MRVRLCVKRRLFRLRTQLSLFWKETAQMQEALDRREVEVILLSKDRNVDS